MTTKNTNFEPLELFIKNKNLTLTDDHKDSISVSNKDEFYIYNYKNGISVPLDDAIIKMCRGIVINSYGKLMNYPFDRFFNYHEKECDKVDIKTAVVQEKIDGSMISAWWDGNEWEITTRGSFYDNNTEGVNFKKEFLRLFDKFEVLDKNYCYQFELCTSVNRIVTKYDTEFVTLIGARELRNEKEVGQDKLDVIANKINVRRPKRFDVTDINGCRKIFDKLNDDEEGLVVVGENSKRFKLKQESYLKMARIISLSNHDLLEYILGNAELDADFSELDDVTCRIKEIESLYKNTINYAKMVFGNLSHCSDRREFASHAKQYSFSPLLFHLLKGVGFDGLQLTYKKLIKYNEDVIEIKPKKLIILRGIPSSGKSTFINENNLNIYTLSADTIRLMYSSPNPRIPQTHNKEVWDTLFYILEERMKQGCFTIIDATHTTQHSINKYNILCEKYGYKIVIKDFVIELDDALLRNKFREEYKKVPEDVIKRMYKQLNPYETRL